jgi:preprotein translocase subunit YajC
MKHVLTLALLTIPSLVFADGAAPAQGGGIGGLMPIILIFAVFYFLILRPQQKKAKEHQTMVNNIKRDDKIVTSGGVYARVTNVKGEVIEAEIAEGVKVEIAKSAVATILGNVNEPVMPEVVSK